mmetsp:Transcript_1114/g.3197  ORF Transcript_1114/g.3197 Transcript_1114/m.3197 type:complete len:216 (-) Transcript_1114:1676-2323(-)
MLLAGRSDDDELDEKWRQTTTTKGQEEEQGRRRGEGRSLRRRRRRRRRGSEVEDEGGDVVGGAGGGGGGDEGFGGIFVGSEGGFDGVDDFVVRQHFEDAVAGQQEEELGAVEVAADDLGVGEDELGLGEFQRQGAEAARQGNAARKDALGIFGVRMKDDGVADDFAEELLGGRRFGFLRRPRHLAAQPFHAFLFARVAGVVVARQRHRGPAPQSE